MNTALSQLKANKEAQTTALLTECGVFFAFSDAQFEANKTPLQDGERYSAIGGGGYAPKSKVSDLSLGIDKINADYWQAIEDNNLKNEVIFYELSNYECFYTYDISDAKSALPEHYTDAEIWAVFHANKDKFDC